MEPSPPNSQPKRRSWWVRGLLWLGSLVLFLAVLFGGGYYVIQWNGNFHVVEDKALYRSAQLSGEELKAFVGQYGIRTVINLRGENKGTDWYDEEMQAVQQLGVKHVDFGMSAREQLTLKEMQELIHLMKTLPQPILVHCGAGTDRTGLACSLYLLAKGRSPEEAARALSLKYGHFPYLGSDTVAMDKSLELYIKEQVQR